MFGAGAWSLKNDWNPASGYTSWTMPFPPHWHIGGVFLIGTGVALTGVIALLVQQRYAPAFFARWGPGPEPQHDRAITSPATPPTTTFEPTV